VRVCAQNDTRHLASVMHDIITAHHAKYVGQRSLGVKVSGWTQTGRQTNKHMGHTHTHTYRTDHSTKTTNVVSNYKFVHIKWTTWLFKYDESCKRHDIFREKIASIMLGCKKGRFQLMFVNCNSAQTAVLERNRKRKKWNYIFSWLLTATVRLAFAYRYFANVLSLTLTI